MTEKSLAINQALGVERLGNIMWESGYWQDTRSQAQAIVKILAGAELDFGPIASMNGIFIIEGRTSLSANLVGAAIQRSGRYRYRVVEHDAKHCVIDFFEIGIGKREKIGQSSFSLEDARLAGLLGKRGGNWEKFPRNMVFSRALTNGARWYTPDVFGGPVFTPDELGGEVDGEGNAIEVIGPEPQPEPDAQGERMVISADERVWQRWEEVRAEALGVGVVPPSLSLPISYDRLVEAARALKQQAEALHARLAREEAARAAGAAAHAEMIGRRAEPPDAWAINRQLMEQGYAQGLRLSELTNTTPLAEVEARNAELRQLLATHQEA